MTVKEVCEMFKNYEDGNVCVNYEHEEGDLVESDIFCPLEVSSVEQFIAYPLMYKDVMNREVKKLSVDGYNNCLEIWI